MRKSYLRYKLIFAIALSFTTPAAAQYGAAPAPDMPIVPGMGGNPNIYGNSFANDYNRYGEDYARSRAYDRPSTYQPYPSIDPPNRPLNGRCVGCLHDPYTDE